MSFQHTQEDFLEKGWTLINQGKDVEYFACSFFESRFLKVHFVDLAGK